jgi:hypothetical protein
MQYSHNRLWNYRSYLYRHHESYRGQVFSRILTDFYDVFIRSISLFGIVLLATECKIDFILKRVGIIRTLAGRGIFNI